MAITKEINIVVKESGLDKVNSQVDKLDASLEDLQQTQHGVSKSMQDSSSSVLANGGAMGLLNDATGGLAMTIKDAVEATDLFTKSEKAKSIMTAISTTVVGASTGAMKLFRIALASTGIGLIVIGLGLLIANFGKVKDAVLNFIPGLKQVGEFIGGLVDGFTDFIGITSDATRAMENLTSQAEKSLALNKKYLSEEGDRLNKYTKQKIDAKNAYNEAIKEDGADQVALANRLARELKAIDESHNSDLEKARKDKQDKIDEENKKISDKQKTEQEKRLADEKKRIEDEAKIILDAQMQSAKDAISILDELDKNKESPAQKEQREFEEKRAILEENNLSTEELEVQHVDALFEISEADRLRREESELQYRIGESERAIKADEEKKRLAEEQKIRDKAVADNALEVGNLTFSLLGSLAKKGSKLAKGVAVAQATMDTYKSAVAAYAAGSSLPGPVGIVAGPLMAGLAVVAGLANVKKILSTKEDGSGGAGGGGSAAPPAPSFNLVQGTSRNQIAETVTKQAPVKAFVVSKDMSTGQEMDRNIIKGASL